MPTRSEVTAFQDSLNVVSQAAQDEVQQVFESLDWDTPDTALRQLRAAVQEIVPRYADATVSLSAQWVEDQLGLPAELPKVMHKRYIGRRLKWSTAKAFEGDIVQALETTLQVIDHMVSGPGKKTISESCRKHGVRWARVPRGSTTCRFCLMLASRGYVYESAEKAGRVDQFHTSCDCVIVPEDGIRPAGYDPDALYKEWQRLEAEAAATDADNSAV